MLTGYIYQLDGQRILVTYIYMLRTRLCSYVKQVLKCRIQRTSCWTDGSAALHWIRGPSGQYKEYVATNRVNAINKLTEPQCRRYCPSDDNPADLSSRGITATQLIHCNHGWNGPSWLSQPEGQFPSDLKVTENIPKEERGFQWWRWTLLTMQNPWIRKVFFSEVAAGNCMSCDFWKMLTYASPSERNTGVLSAEN